MRRFLRGLAARCSIDVKKRGIGLHSLRIAREAAWDAGVKDLSIGARRTALTDAASVLHVPLSRQQVTVY